MVTNSSSCSHFGASVSSAFLFLSVFGSVSVRGVIHEPAAVPLPSRWRADVDVTTGLPHEERIPRWSDLEPSDERERWARLHEDEDVVDKQALRRKPIALGSRMPEQELEPVDGRRPLGPRRLPLLSGGEASAGAVLGAGPADHGQRSDPEGIHYQEPPAEPQGLAEFLQRNGTASKGVEKAPSERRHAGADDQAAAEQEAQPDVGRGGSSACGDLRGQLVAPSSSSVQILGLPSGTYCWVPACGMMAGGMIGPAMPQCDWFVSCGNQGRFVTAGPGSPALDPVAGGAQFPPPSGPHNFPAEMSFYCTPAWTPSPYPAQQAPSTYSPEPHEDTGCVGGLERGEPGAGFEQASSRSSTKSYLVEATLLEDSQPEKSRSAAATAATKSKENQICGRIPLAVEFSERIADLGRPGVQREQLQQEQDDFFLRHGALNTGSQGHWEARCRPCGFLYKPQGCQVDDCGFCHACGENAMKLRKKARVALLRGRDDEDRDEEEYGGRPRAWIRKLGGGRGDQGKGKGSGKSRN